MLNLTPFQFSDGNRAEAVTFYAACFGVELVMMKVRDTPMKDQVPLEHHDKIINAHLGSGPIEFTATDWLHQARSPRSGTTVGMCLNGGTLTELPALFHNLSIGADPELIDELSVKCLLEVRDTSPIDTVLVGSSKVTRSSEANSIDSLSRANAVATGT